MKEFKKERILWLLHRFWLLPILFLAVMLLPAGSMAQEQILQHVYDNAGYFSNEEVENLEALCLEYGEASEANIILMIEDGVAGKQWKKFMEDFYDAHEAELGTAALLLLDINEEERRIELQGYGEMEYYLSDSRIEDVLDMLIVDLKNGYYYEALASFPAMVKDYYDRGYADDARTHTEADNENYDPYYYENEEAGVFECMLIAFPVSLVIAAIATFIMAYNAGGKDTTTFRSYMDETRNNLIGRYDRYTHTTTSKRQKPKDDNNSSGGGGGISSGGNSHSGGGRSF